MAGAPSSAPPIDPRRAIRGARKGGGTRPYTPPPADRLEQMERFLRAWSSGNAPSPPAGFVHHFAAGGVELIGTRRPASDGVYLLRRNPVRRVLVEVPHSFFDEHTLALGQALFSEIGALGLLVNTVHRYRGAGCPAEPGRTPCLSDMAHRVDSVFHAVHKALSSAQRPLVIAVHGFRPQKSDPDVIVSAAGTRLDVTCFAQRLRRLWPTRVVAINPADTRRLGGHTCAQARHLRATGGKMLHVELCAALRRRLGRSGRKRRALAAALVPCLKRALIF